MIPTRTPWRRLRWAAAGLVAILTYGVAGYMILESWSFLDALYMTVLTLTTVGYKEVHPLDPSGQVFTMTVLVSGVSLLLVTLTVAATEITASDYGQRVRRRKMQRRVDDLKDHCIVCAYGRVGRAVARQLQELGTPFVVLDRDEALEQRMIEDGVTYIVGDPARQDVLEAAGIARAKALVSAVDSDAENVYITLSARALNDDLFIVARASQGQTIDRLDAAGADRVVSPYRHSGKQMAVLATQPQVSDYLEVQAGEHVTLRVEEVVVNEDSGLIGKSVADVAVGKTPLALRRAAGRVVTPPDAASTLELGDVLLLLRESPGAHR